MDYVATNSAEIINKSRKSVKWSLLGEILAKLATPISTMILARLLTPNIFGIATAVAIVVSFCESISDSGFAKYIIQHDFIGEDEYNKYFSVSFYVSIFLSLALCALVVILRFPLSNFVGNEGYEMVLVVSCIQVPFATVNALFTACLRRKFEFKKIFITKIIYSLVPIAVTVPLALLKFEYWSLVFGSIIATVVMTPFLIMLSKQKVQLYFSFNILKKILGVSTSMIIESVVIWFCAWISTFLAANFYDQTTIGIVKVAGSTVTSIFTLFSTAFLSVLFPTLSRLKGDQKAFQESFYSIQSATLAILLPLGIGGYFFSDVLTKVFLGSGWAEASFTIGIFCLAKPLMLCFNNFLSETFRAKGHFYSSIFYQLVMLVQDVIFLLTLGRVGFNAFVVATLLSNCLTTIICIFILRLKFKILFSIQLKSVIPSIICCVPLVLVATTKYLTSYSFYQSFVQVFVCAFVYFFSMVAMFPNLFSNLLSYFISKNKKTSDNIPQM